MTSSDTAVSLKIPTRLIEKLDTIAKLKYLNREAIIIDACTYYCQFCDMNSEQLPPETMRSVFFNLARHDEEFRTLLQQVLRDVPTVDPDNNK